VKNKFLIQTPSPEVPRLQTCGQTTLRNNQWQTSMKYFPCSYWFTHKKPVVFYPSNLQTWDYRTHDWTVDRQKNETAGCARLPESACTSGLPAHPDASYSSFTSIAEPEPHKKSELQDAQDCLKVHVHPVCRHTQMLRYQRVELLSMLISP
jgi:hypothetical protein